MIALPDVAADQKLSRRAADTASDPAALFHIAATQLWNSFALYGTMSLFALYLTSELLLPHHVELLWGFSAFDKIFGGLSPVATSSVLFGIFAGSICVTPIIGGMAADRYWGARKTIVIGASVLVAGYTGLFWKQSFLIALTMIVIGCGCVLGNLKAQIGSLYERQGGQHARGYGISLIASNLGVLIAPLVCGTVGELYGWRYGFATAALGMMIGLIVYLVGSRHFPVETTRAANVPELRILRRANYPLLAVILLNILYFGTYNQTFNILPIWIREAVDRSIWSGTIPTTWFLALDGLFSIVVTAALLRLWRRRARLGQELSGSSRLRAGFGCLALAFLTLAAGNWAAEPGRASWLLLPAFFLMTAAASALIITSTLTFIARAAPEGRKGTFVGLFAVSAFAGNLLVGWTGSFYETIGATNLWLVQAALAGTAFLLVAKLASRLEIALLRPQ